jgi:hypothetical protein
MTPSTEWKEVTGPGEAALFERLATELAEMQRANAQRSGATRRGLHAKTNVTARATLDVLGGLPEHARVGLFASPRSYEAVVRFSNGSGGVHRDRAPDVRGIAVKVLGVEGKKLIPGLEQAATQDFLAILSAAVPFKDPEEFVWVVTHAGNPVAFLVKALFHLGPGRTASLLGSLQKGLATKVASLAFNRYFSALPIRFGPLAAKYCFEPENGPLEGGETSEELGEELGRRLERGPLSWDLRVQFFEDEVRTPIEDPTVEWKAPWLTVARLNLPKQSVTSAAGQRLAGWAEQLSFDPWHAPVEFRPLGAMMRSRSAAYRVSNQTRGAAPEPTALPSTEG